MSAKRGRPLSDTTNDPAVLRRRQHTAARVREYRERQRAARATITSATPAQHQQAAAVVELPFNDQDAAVTLTQLGLRVQNLTLAQNSEDARLQQDVIPVIEHFALYQNSNAHPVLSRPLSLKGNIPTPPGLPVIPSDSHQSRSNQSSVTRFFRSLPPTNPLLSPQPRRVSENPLQISTQATSPDIHITSNPIFNDILGTDNGDSFKDLPEEEGEGQGEAANSVDEHATMAEREHEENGNKAAPMTAVTPEGSSPALTSQDSEESINLTSIRLNEEPDGNRVHGGSEHSPALSQGFSAVEDISYFFQEIGDSFPVRSSVPNNPTSVRSPTPSLHGQIDHRPSEPASVEDSSLNEGEASSQYSFESERRIHGEDHSSPSVELSAQAFTVEKLYDQLQGGFHGCSKEQHAGHLREHMNAVGDNHHSLDQIFHDAHFPSVLALSDIISPDRLARQANPTAEQWESIFCGIAPHRRSRMPIHVCLHKEETRAVEPQVAFDIDSFLGFASSLAVARQGLWYQPAPQMRQNMTTDVHLESNIFRPSEDPEQAPRSSFAMLKDIPHFLLGRVEGAHDITIHILFPHLVPNQDKFVSLTKEQLSRWLDRVFHPAVYRYCEAHYTQHLPASYRHALANSKARQVEGRMIETASYQAQQALGYHLQPEYLHQIWSEILQTITDTPGLDDFRDPQLFFSAKGTKLQFKTSPSRPTMLDAMENFQTYFERVMDLDFVFRDRFYVDLGKEICPRVSLLSTQRAYVDDEAQVYSWKRCCLQRYLGWLYDGQPPARGARGQRFYDQNMLYNASGLTSLTPKLSRLREGGLIYSQFYGSVKEVTDAAKCIPFDNDGLEELALDPQIRQGARSAAGGHRRDAKVIERAYCASKCRARDALRDSLKKSFGIREEHRMSWSLFQALLTQLRLELRENLEIILTDCPSYAWAVKTEVYLNYLWRNADKFATGFEIVLARCQQDLVTWEQTKMMAMFLRCLRFVFGGHQLSRESALWWSRRERPVGDPPQARIWYGLGFSNTLARYGYCWIEPRIDWGRVIFQSQYTDQVLFGNSVLRGQYLRRGGRVQDFFDTTRRLELALEWLERHHQRTIRDRLIFWMVHLCLQQFRIDTLSGIVQEISEPHRDEATRGHHPFSLEYFHEIMGPDVHLISGNRCDFKAATHLGHFLFDFNDGRVRKHWEDRPFRKLYRRARTALTLRYTVEGLAAIFSRRLWRTLYAYHWILPYPSAEVFTQTTKQGARMWYSIQTDPTPAGSLYLLEPEQWQWARKSWRAGFPPALPRFLSWTKEEWQAWIQRHGGPG